MMKQKVDMLDSPPTLMLLLILERKTHQDSLDKHER